MFKRLRTVVLVAALGAGLSACGDDDSFSGSADVDASVEIDGFDDVCRDAASTMLDAVGGVADAVSGDHEDLDGAVKSLQGFVDAAPEVIRADAQVLFDGYSEYLTIYTRNGLDTLNGDEPSAEQLAAVEQAGDALDTKEFKASFDNVIDWVAEHCLGG